jgi:hypothetical protein
MVLLGTNGSGKTYWFRHVIEPKADRLLIIDTEDMEFPDIETVKGDGAKVAKSFPPIDKKFRWKWVPPATKEIAEMEKFAEGVLRNKNAQWSVIYIDEASDFADALRIKDWFRSLFRKARKRHISLVVGSQRPAGFNKWAFDNSHHKVFFFVREFDRKGLDKLWPGISEELAQIEWESFESVYIDPSGYVQHLGAAE